LNTERYKVYGTLRDRDLRFASSPC